MLTCFAYHTLRYSALTYSSSVMTPSLAGISRHYHVSSEAAIVTLSLFVLGESSRTRHVQQSHGAEMPPF